MVHEEGLEGIKIKGGRWEDVQGVSFFLLGCFFFIISVSGFVVLFFLGMSFLFFFFLGRAVGFDDLGSEFDVT